MRSEKNRTTRATIARAYNKRIRTIKDYIKANYRDITLESVARHANESVLFIAFQK